MAEIASYRFQRITIDGREQARAMSCLTSGGRCHGFWSRSR